MLPTKAADAKPARKIEEVKKILPKLFTTELFYASMAAWDFADLLRRRRNDGAHPKPTYAFDDAAEIEELLISAGRHLPAIWQTAI